MFRQVTKLSFISALAALSVCVQAQDVCLPLPNWGWYACLEPPDPYSDDFAPWPIAEYSPTPSGGCDDAPLMNITLGQSGSATYGPTFCFDPGFSMAITGGIGFGIGSIGSIQTERDNFMMLTFGMPLEPGNAGGYAAVIKGDNRTRIPGGDWPLFFRGLSDRYILAEATVDNVLVGLRVDVVGDAARLHWTLTNLDGEPAQLGLWFGNFIAMMDQTGEIRGFIEGALGARRAYTFIPGQLTPVRETRWLRAGNPDIFPTAVHFDWSQEEPYGLRIENEPSSSTIDPITGETDAERADEFVLGIQGATATGVSLVGELNEVATFPDTMFPIVVNEPGIQQSDLPWQDNPAYIQKYYPETVLAGGRREIVQYFRTTWGQSNYLPPYAIVVDAPRIFNHDPAGLNQLTPNPATVRVWVDNIRGFTGAEEEIPLVNVRITLDLNETTGITMVGGAKVQTKLISRIDAKRYGFVDFQIQADGILPGTFPYTVRVEAPPGPSKSIDGTMQVMTQPKIDFEPGANLVSMPWLFDNTAWTSILGLSQPTQFQAFAWDAVQQGYVFTTSAERGKAAWIVIKDASVTTSPLMLQSDPEKPTDMDAGGLLVQLQQGWNMIGNPYSYPIELGGIVGVTAGDPTRTYSWRELVDGGFVSGALAYWDSDAIPPSYKFISGITAQMQPQVGYWIFVQDIGLTLKFPRVSIEGAILNDGFGGFSASREWKQTDKQWRLMLVARNSNEIDDQNFVGVAATAKASKETRIYEPPMGPIQRLAASIAAPTAGGTRMAQTLSERSGRQEWTMLVESKDAGQVTVTWPNMSTVPKNVRFRMVDSATGTTRDMRKVSGYTFEAEAGTTRQIKVQAEPGTVSRAVIGNVVVSRPGRDRTAPFTINYTLSASATTTVRILGAGGKEIFTATRGRADRAGENTVSWAMRDNANRAVAPGAYRVEIVAETGDGERVRKIVPINVVR